MNNKRKSQKQKETAQRDNLIRGSIRCEYKEIFSVKGTKSHIELRYGTLEPGYINPPMSNDVKTIFETAGIDAIPGKHETSDLIQTLSDSRGEIEITGIEWDGVTHVRLKFTGLTQYQFDARKERIEEFLNNAGIEHGEKDGKDICVFGCMTKQQYELIAPHWWS